MVDETALREALLEGRIVPFFQPLVELRTGRLVGFEVLARLQHPVHGLVLPGQFIPEAERTGLIGPLTDLLLSAACTAAAGWPEHLTLSVNLSPLQLQDQALPDRLHALAEAAGFPMRRLVFEITESGLIDNLELAVPIAKRLKALGALLALDDFGTGYASLRYLQALPYDKIKIDAGFVRSMSQRRDCRKIVATIVGLGHSLDLVTVAEGVEDETQAHMLLGLGCDLGQGWLFGPPAAAADIPAMIARISSTMPLRPPVGGPAADMMLGLEVLPHQRLAQLQALYDGAPVGLAMLDRNLRYVSLNTRLAEFHGCPVADHIGRSLSDLLPEVARQVGPSIRRALAGEPASDVEVRIPFADNPDQQRVMLVSYLPVRNAAQDIEGVSVAVVDITERSRAEHALVQAEKLKSIGQHASGIVHDFNNLLTAVTLNIETVSMLLPADDPAQGIIACALDAATLSAQLNRRLLSFARPQALLPRSIDVDLFIGRFKHLAMRLLGERHSLQFRPCAARKPHICTVDAAQLETAILNLIVNARDAMPEGGQIVLETRSVRIVGTRKTDGLEMPPGTYIKVAVTDTGTGMPQGVIKRAFEPFFSTKPAGAGTGLGLSMVQAFARQSGGDVGIHSQPGLGTTVQLYLPAAMADANAAGGSPEAQAWGGAPVRTLLVEDRPRVLMAASRLCRSIGLDVVAVGSAEQALAVLRDDPSFALLFTDLMLPGKLGGFELAQHARRHISGLKVLYTSGCADDAVIGEAQRDPGAEFLSKPYRRSQLVAALQLLLAEPGD